MSKRARQLAEQFERANDEFIAFIERLSDAEWQMLCPGEGRTVAALAHHVAVAYRFEMRVFQAIATGQTRRSVTWDDIHRSNAADAETYARCDRAETVQLLRRNAADAAGIARHLTDEQLQREGQYIDGGASRTVEQWISRVLLGHIREHLASIQTAVAAKQH